MIPDIIKKCLAGVRPTADEIEAALVTFLEQFLEEAATP